MWPLPPSHSADYFLFYMTVEVWRQVLTIPAAIELLVHDGIIINNVLLLSKVLVSFLFLGLFNNMHYIFRYLRSGLHAEWSHAGDFLTVCANKII